MKNKIRYRSKRVSPQRSLSTQRLSKIIFSAFSHRGVGLIPYGPEAAISAVNSYFSFLIRLAARRPATGLIRWRNT